MLPIVRPFRALRYNASVVGDLEAVLCPPYDVISPAQQAELQRQSSFNAVHLELPAGPFEGEGNRYQWAGKTLSAWIEQEALIRERHPAYYLHETDVTLNGERRVRRDLIGALDVEPWAAGAVKPHEHTMAGPKADRLALIRATHANLSPIWVLHRERIAALDRAWDLAQGREPSVQVKYEDEIHRLWVVDAPGELQALQSALGESPLYIADGHHRYETALAFRQEAETELPGARSTLAVVTWAEDPGMIVLPTHRLLRKLPAGQGLAELRAAWQSSFDVTPVDLPAGASDDEVGAEIQRRLGAAAPAAVFAIMGPGRDALTVLRAVDPDKARASLPTDRSAAWRALDLALLHGAVLDPLVEAADLDRDENLSYTRDAVEAVSMVRSGSAAVAFHVNSTPVSQVLAVADARDRMPEKSTYFYPKPPTGLVIRSVDDGCASHHPARVGSEGSGPESSPI